MSASLYWEIIPTEPKSNNVGWLLEIFKQKYGDDLDNSIVLDESDISFLEGCKLAGSKEISIDASRLISAIKKHGNIKVYKSY
jgi:hypothetical protein